MVVAITEDLLKLNATYINLCIREILSRKTNNETKNNI